jgi:hypothetical protein
MKKKKDKVQVPVDTVEKVLVIDKSEVSVDKPEVLPVVPPIDSPPIVEIVQEDELSTLIELVNQFLGSLDGIFIGGAAMVSKAQLMNFIDGLKE